MVRKLKTNCAFKLLILEEREEKEMETGANIEFVAQVLPENKQANQGGRLGCCRYFDTGGEREESYYMPVYLHSLSIWLQLQLQRWAEGVLYLNQPQADSVSLCVPD